MGTVGPRGNTGALSPVYFGMDRTKASDIPASRAALAGLVAGGAALAAGALVAAFAAPSPGPVSAVAGWVIDGAPGWLVQLGKDLFGTNNKRALIVGVIVTSGLFALIVGRLASRNRMVGSLLLAGFGAFGFWTMWTDPEGTPMAALSAAIAATVVGIWTLNWLLDQASPARVAAQAAAPTPPPAAQDPAAHTEALPQSQPSSDPRDPAVGRRGFMAGAGTVGLVAAVAATAGTFVRSSRSRAEEARAAVDLVAADPEVSAAAEAAATGPIGSTPGITPLVVPSEDYYRIDTAQFGVPQVDPADWVLSIDGMVDTPLQLTYQDLLDEASVTAPVTLSCVSNEVGGPLVGNAIWDGIPLTDLLDRAGVDPAATQIVGHSVDGWTGGFPTEAVRDGRTALLAVGMNGEPLPLRHGFPARLVISGLYGYVSATKWLSRIELTTLEDFDGFWIPRGWSKFGPVKTQSRIDTPRSGERVTAGQSVPIAGVAWAPATGIAGVEVKVGDADWQPAELGESLGIDAWRQWRLMWTAEPGEHMVQVRATDESGYTQTPGIAPPAPDGATGWHSILLRST